MLWNDLLPLLKSWKKAFDSINHVISTYVFSTFEYIIFSNWLYNVHILFLILIRINCIMRLTVYNMLSCMHLTTPTNHHTCQAIHNHDTVSAHFNQFYWMEFCDKLRGYLSMFTYIYFNVDKCWLTSSMPQQSLNSKLCLIMLSLQKMSFMKTSCSS